jgi:co-chaperonin GroES (HSP10)
MTLKTDAGSLVTVNVSEKTTYERMPPGETDRAKAVKISMTEITVGDGVYARGYVAADHKSVPAQQIVVVSQSDIAKKQEKERAEWRRRGVSGIVASLNPTTKEVTISSRSLMGAPQAIIIPVTDKVKMRRYPPDSIPKYSDAKPSKFEEVKVGDQFRALGDKSADGTRLTAEEAVFGTFRIAGGTVTAIDPAANKISMNDLQTKKPITIILKPDSVLRRFVQMMGGGPGGPGGGAAAGQGQGTPPAQGGAAGAQGPRPGGPGGPGMNVADLLDRLPIISINQLKVGDTIIMSTLPGSDPNQVTAISLVTGIEPLLQMIAMRQQAGGQPRPQNVDLNSNFGGMFGGIGGP